MARFGLGLSLILPEICLKCKQLRDTAGHNSRGFLSLRVRVGNNIGKRIDITRLL